VEGAYLAQHRIDCPYFHNGAAKTLNEAVTIMAKTQLDKELSKEEIADIVAFLNGLTGEFPKQKMPVLPATLVQRSINDIVETRYSRLYFLIDKMQ